VSDDSRAGEAAASVLADDDDLASAAATIQFGQTVCPLGTGVAPPPATEDEQESAVADD
jgi:hypothetical protein